MDLSRVLRWPLKLIPPGAILPVLTGPLRGYRWVNRSATHGCWLGTYERLAQRVFAEHVREGNVVFDIGAHAGFFTLLGAKLVGTSGRVYAFEPVAANASKVRQHLRLNRVANAQVFRLALSSRNGLASFSTGADSSTGSLSDNGDLTVQAARLDDLRLPGPDFIKMDVEGSEFAVLSGARDLLKRTKPVLLLATHGFHQHQICSDFLLDIGYRLDLLIDGTHDGNYLLLAESLGQPNLLESGVPG